ncbi:MULTISPECIES: glycoside hydrolase family 1 protein [Kosmotoga]|uniref:Beta-glucosidase n=1 Tax=Kosmotoga olearia (strain ATCC BAA-1733 / DSM 21960 / TBF 19.5.1) TaxID=521045 RepID=C5CDW5_KOSOT|nr:MULTISPECIES: glycoside hydrolase family 1 protein [Kosmotoga]ACR79134.1 Beta-glucosidase [Kosmotoga olearia TBF 19.5.1]MDI3524561.1 beta-glucosidase [Kosmotoga sp.]MDK2954159.1 beta-glucosidase [Kosmotoga sp.]OAA23828.1 beta-glucosidase [Kosmotoga sp. DU53]
MKSFPAGFMWGVATAGHQIEGGNYFSDWYKWEMEGKVKNGDTSETACDSWNQLDRDLEILKKLSVKAYRYSIEWARVEPKLNKFDEESLNKYRDFTIKLVEANIKPIITLHHFVNPQWFAEIGGWESRENLRYFLRYVNKVVDTLGEFVPFWITINEPNVYAIKSYLMGEWPPEVKDRGRAFQVLKNLLIAHTEAYDIIKSRYPSAMVSVAYNFVPFYPYRKWHPLDIITAFTLNKTYNYAFLDSIKHGKFYKPIGSGEKNKKLKDKLDFIGVNYYTRYFVKYSKPEPELVDTGNKKTDMGYEFYPEGLRTIIMKCHKDYSLPILITENGIADATDEKRWKYIKKALEAVHKSLKGGAKVIGYMYWSLMDNFEWSEGYSMKFGLYKTKRNPLELVPRSSASKYADVIKNNALTDDD